ncbi:ribosome maturation factor RimM [Methylomonas paludis]|uniref:Ribosome maturation factor RimM n=1 Tax=Methylomonas paludis TaxID=1173101 RepID=A0A975R9Q0_9GAMM|nr:ribosome maturation factor RimM [Methylomonas paludis]QWF70518.1 ribosome maturation factor RimM [Methylomonas paludis]
MPNQDFLNAGQISGVFGVKGWVKIYSFTEPRENILSYTPWVLQKNQQTREVKVLAGQRHGNTVVAELEGVSDRDAAFALLGSDILIRRAQLPAARAGEYYWTDLVGLAVETAVGIKLGKVDHLLETGANDVLVVKDGEIERLIPFLQPQTVLSIDLAAELMIVDWDPDF